MPTWRVNFAERRRLDICPVASIGTSSVPSRGLGYCVPRHRVVLRSPSEGGFALPAGCRCSGGGFDRTAGSPFFGRPPEGTVIFPPPGTLPYPPASHAFMPPERTRLNTLHVRVECSEYTTRQGPTTVRTLQREGLPTLHVVAKRPRVGTATGSTCTGSTTINSMLQ